MLEPETLHDVVELDVDAEVVAVELELVATRPERALLFHVHREACDGPVDGEVPVDVAIGVRVERHGRVGELGHGPSGRESVHFSASDEGWQPDVRALYCMH